MTENTIFPVLIQSIQVSLVVVEISHLLFTVELWLDFNLHPFILGINYS